MNNREIAFYGTALAIVTIADLTNHMFIAAIVAAVAVVAFVFGAFVDGQTRK